MGSEMVRCWGRNDFGQLGYEHACALLTTGAVRCWERNDFGQLGLGHTRAVGDDEVLASEPGVNVGGTVLQVAAGMWHTCALLSSGTSRRWGRNTYGQLGLGHTYNLGDNEPPSGDAVMVPLPPQLLEVFQSATSVGEGGSVTFRVQAMDPQASSLTFSWTASTGHPDGGGESVRSSFRWHGEPAGRWRRG